MEKQELTFTSTQQWTLLATITASSLVFIDGSALNVALPVLQQDLGVKGTQLLWIVNGYALFLSALLLVGGSLGDLYGRNKIFLVGLLIFSVSSLFAGLAQTPNILIISRCFQGVGGALLTPGSLSILSSQFEPGKRGRAIGLWSTFSALTGVIGPVLGGWLASLGLWRVIFFINVPLALIITYVVLGKVPETKSTKVLKLDTWGAIMVTLGLAGLTYGFIESPTHGFDTPFILSALLIGMATFIGFLVIEAKTPHPMMPLNLFKSKLFSTTNLVTFVVYAALGCIMFFLPLNLVQIQGYTSLQAGLSLLPIIILISSISPFMGRYVDKRGPRLPLIAGPFITGIGFFLFYFVGITPEIKEYWTSFFPAFLLVGIGMGITVAPLTTAVMGAVSEDSIGIASGVNNTVARTAGVLAIALLGSLVLISFESYLNEAINGMNFTKEIQQEILIESANLGAAQAPLHLETNDIKLIESTFKNAFVYSFNRVSLIASTLCWIGAVASFIFIKSELQQ